MNLFDQFLATQGRMAQNEGQELINRANLQKITEAERAQKMQNDTLAFYQNQRKMPETATLANLSEMKEVPDAGAESQGLRQMAKEPTPAPKKISAAESLMSSADEAGRMAKELQSINPAEADRLRKERDNLLTKAAPLVKEERLAKQEENAQVMQWMGAVKDEPTFQNVMAQIKQFKPEMYKAWAELQLPNGAPAFPRNLDGSFAYTPQTQKITETVAKASMKEYERAQVAEKIEDNKRADLELEQKKKKDEADIRYQNARLAALRENRTPSPDASTEITDEAIEEAAARYNIDGTFPPNIGRGKQGAVLSAKILSRAAELAKADGKNPEDSRVTQLTNKASAQALGQITKQEQMVGAFEKNALKNLDIAVQASKDVDRTGVPALNRWILAGKKSLAGDAAVAKFHAANTTFVNEYAKIMSGSMGNTVVSDSLRRETETLLATKDTPEQYEAVTNLMKQEMANRMKGFAEQKAELTGSMKRRATDKPADKPADPNAFSDAEKERRYQEWKQKNGK